MHAEVTILYFQGIYLQWHTARSEGSGECKFGESGQVMLLGYLRYENGSSEENRSAFTTHFYSRLDWLVHLFGSNLLVVSIVFQSLVAVMVP